MRVDPARIGVIGAGGMGREHIANLHLVPNVSVVVVADADADAAADGARLAEARAETDAHKVIADDRLDGIIIASPDETHADLAVAALDAGLMVLCEKPLAHDLGNAERVLSAEMRQGRRRLQVGFMREYDPAHQQVASALAELGEPHHLRCVHRNANGDNPREVEAVLTQSVIHDVHTIRWLTGGEIKSIAAHVAYRGASDFVAAVHLVAEVVDDAGHESIATIDFDDVSYAYEVSVEASTGTGMVTMAPPMLPTVGVAGVARNDVGTDWFARFREAYVTEANVWAGSVVTAGLVPSLGAVGPGVWDGVAAQAVIEAALRSVGSGDSEPVDTLTKPELYR